MRRLPLRRSRRGSPAIEFALVLPIFLAIVLGMFVMSWMFFTRSSVIAATREGCRAAAVLKDDAQATTYAKETIDNRLAFYGVNCASEYVCDIKDPTFAGEFPEKTMRCHTIVEYRSVTGFISGFTELVGISEVRREVQ
jgi:hypothetical protein